MNLSIEGRPSRAQAIATIQTALEAGVTMIDTADVYGLGAADAGHNERLIAEAGVAASAATKVGVRREGEAWVHDGSPAYLRRAIDASLRALGVETIELLILHAVDARVPIEDSVGAIVDARSQGKVRQIGVSNVTAAELARARAVAPIACVQNEASPFVAPEPGLLELCARERIAFLAYAPTGGWRAGRLAHEPWLQRLAARYGRTCFEVTLAALLACSPGLLVVSGASRPENARSSARAAGLALEPEDVEAFRARFWADGRASER